MNGAKIFDYDKEEIFNPKKRDSNQSYTAPPGRRSGDKSDNSNTYKPK